MTLPHPFYPTAGYETPPPLKKKLPLRRDETQQGFSRIIITSGAWTCVSITIKGTRYANVSTTMMENDDEYEEALVYVKFEADANMLMNAQGIQLIDVDGPNPRCEVDGVQFIGQHQINLGTVLFFSKGATEESSSCIQDGDQPQNASSVRLVGSTERLLTFKAKAQPVVEGIVKKTKKKAPAKKVKEEPTEMDVVETEDDNEK